MKLKYDSVESSDDLIICFQDVEGGYDEENRLEYITLHHKINRRHLYGR
jgi:hypothetical protein